MYYKCRSAYIAICLPVVFSAVCPAMEQHSSETYIQLETWVGSLSLCYFNIKKSMLPGVLYYKCCVFQFRLCIMWYIFKTRSWYYRCFSRRARLHVLPRMNLCEERALFISFVKCLLLQLVLLWVRFVAFLCPLNLPLPRFVLRKGPLPGMASKLLPWNCFNRLYSVR